MTAHGGHIVHVVEARGLQTHRSHVIDLLNTTGSCLIVVLIVVIAQIARPIIYDTCNIGSWLLLSLLFLEILLCCEVFQMDRRYFL